MRRLFAISLIAAWLGAAGTVRAEPLVVERIVATVDGQPLFFSTLRERARPFVHRLTASSVPRWRQAAQIKDIYRELLQRLVDDTLVARAAREADVVVRPADVDEALARIAAANKVDVNALYAQELEAGYSKAQTRDSIRRQLLEQRMFARHLAARHVHFKDVNAVRKEHDQWLAELRRQAVVEVRLTP
jgi:peptidyl-prolyl cis-trans isomerase SurA